MNEEWSYKISCQFKQKLDKRLKNLTIQPFVGSKSENLENTRSILISKQNRLVYRVTHTKIVVIDLIDTRQKQVHKK